MSKRRLHREESMLTTENQKLLVKHFFVFTVHSIFNRKINIKQTKKKRTSFSCYRVALLVIYF